jgi:PAS domain S-box-containing protein
MKTFNIIIFALTLLLLVLFTTNTSYSASGDWKKGDPRPIKVVMDNNYPPYSFKDSSGRLQGILIDQWRLWELKSGVKAELHGMDWGEAGKRMESGEFDVIDTIFHTEQRSQLYDFTKPYATLNVPIFFNKDINGISNTESLKDFTVAVKTGDFAIDFLKNNGVKHLLLFPSYEAILKAAKEHIVEVFVVDAPPAQYFLYKMRISDQFRHSLPLYSGKFHRAVKKGNTQLLSTIEQGFDLISPAELKAIEKKWYGSAMVPPHFLPYILLAGAIVSGMLSVLWIWNRTLRKAVAQKTAEILREVELSRQSAEALRDSKEILFTMLEAIPNPIYLKDAAGVYINCNEAFSVFFGLPKEKIIGATMQDIATQELAAYCSCLENIDLDHQGPKLTETTLPHADGTSRTILMYKSAIRHEDGSLGGLVGGIIDISPLKQVEAEKEELKHQLYQMQKFESIGRLAGGIAHDFNNLLTPIIGYAELAKLKSSDNYPASKMMDSILVAAQKARDLTQQLLSFGRKQMLDFQVLDLNQVISSFTDILRRTIRENIDIRLNLTPEITSLRADRTRIEQVIMNLAVNAQDAIPGKGAIAIDTSAVILDEEFARQHPGSSPGPHILFVVRDNGCGMGKETLQRLFEPFFTTKTTGIGIGLGLATTYGIVKQHGGYICVESEEDAGSSFKVYFPSVDEIPISASVQTHPEKSLSRPQESTILLVEDNVMVRDMSVEILRGAGYIIHVADDVDHAQDLACEYTIDLLLTDVIMPGMSGPELHDVLKKKFPELKVLFMSGYTGNILAHHGIMAEEKNIMQKPFSVDVLLQKVGDSIYSQN